VVPTDEKQKIMSKASQDQNQVNHLDISGESNNSIDLSKIFTGMNATPIVQDNHNVPTPINFSMNIGSELSRTPPLQK